MTHPENVTSIILSRFSESLRRVASKLLKIAIRIKLKACERCSERFTCDVWDKLIEVQELDKET